MKKERIKEITGILFITGIFFFATRLFIQRLPQFIETALYIESGIVGFVFAIVTVLVVRHKIDKKREKKERGKWEETKKRSKEIMRELFEKEKEGGKK